MQSSVSKVPATTQLRRKHQGIPAPTYTQNSYSGVHASNSSAERRQRSPNFILQLACMCHADCGPRHRLTPPGSLTLPGPLTPPGL